MQVAEEFAEDRHFCTAERVGGFARDYCKQKGVPMPAKKTGGRPRGGGTTTAGCARPNQKAVAARARMSDGMAAAAALRVKEAEDEEKAEDEVFIDRHSWVTKQWEGLKPLGDEAFGFRTADAEGGGLRKHPLDLQVAMRLVKLLRRVAIAIASRAGQRNPKLLEELRTINKDAGDLRARSVDSTKGGHPLAPYAVMMISGKWDNEAFIPLESVRKRGHIRASSQRHAHAPLAPR